MENGNPVPLNAEDIAKFLPEMAVKNFDMLLIKNEALGSWISRWRFLEKVEAREVFFSIELLNEIFKEAAYGERKIEDLYTKDLIYFFESKLKSEDKSLLHEHFPEFVEAPTGTKLKINYGLNDNPSIEVRLQEIFGWLTTPEVAHGKVSLVIHLLAPNYRPVQITKDLKSFWNSGYHEVKKELKTRYPKHSWPEDPLTAKPEAKGRRRT